MARFAISDIHGCLRTFKMLLFDKMKFSEADQLFLLGDYINKGPDSKGVLDFIVELQKNGYQVNCLRGNHEQKLLDLFLGNTPGTWLTEQQKLNTLRSFQVSYPYDIPSKYLDQIVAMPLYFKLDKCYLVHAGFYTGIGDPFLDKVAMLNVKKFSYNKSELEGKKVIHGHVPQKLDTILATRPQDTCVNIDAGCVYYKSEGYGNLVGIDIDSIELYVQPNVDQPYLIDSKN